MCFFFRSFGNSVIEVVSLNRLQTVKKGSVNADLKKFIVEVNRIQLVKVSQREHIEVVSNSSCY